MTRIFTAANETGIPTFEFINHHTVDLSFLNSRLDARKQDGSLRSLKEKSTLIDFTSNDYLGLSRSPDLFDIIHEFVLSADKRNGATGSRLLAGNSELTEKTEDALSKIFQSASTLLMNSGYAANLAVFSSLPQRGDTILLDELAHACIKDGARLSLAKHFNFRHNDLNDLAHKLERATGRVFIGVESIYSMDGDQCPLEDLIVLAEKYNAIIIMDEAHSTGVMGECGGGLAVSLGLQDRVPIRIQTFGKAMGVHGACVAASEIVRDYLINFARPFIYTTALSPHAVASIYCAFQYLNENQHLQKKLKENIDIFLSSAKGINNRVQSNSSIQTAIFPGNADVKSAAAHLQQKGFDVRPILSPTVPEGSERLRICLHSYNTIDEISSLVNELKTLIS